MTRIEPNDPLMHDAKFLVDARYKHVASGKTYIVVGAALDEKNPENVLVIYKEESGIKRTWARDWNEFTDGRFEFVNSPPSISGEKS